MATTPIVGAALAALFSLSAPAQSGPSIVERLATAKLAESEGRYALAELELRAVLSAGGTGEARQARSLLSALLARSGRGTVAAAATPGGGTADEGLTAVPAPVAQDPKRPDPIQRLIGVLDSGAGSTPEVQGAIKQLRELDGLVVSDLLAALPRLGPFGISNVLELICRRSEPEIAKTLGDMLTAEAPAVVRAVRTRLGRMPRSVSVPLAMRLASIHGEPAARAAALEVLLGDEAMDEAARGLAEDIAIDKDSQSRAALLGALEGARRDWVIRLLDGLRRDESAAVKARATFLWITLQPGLSEDAALAALEGVDRGEVAQRVLWLARTHPDWVRVAAMGVRAAIATSNSHALEDYLEDFEWASRPDLAAAIVLEVPIGHARIHDELRSLLLFLSRTGWTLPAELDGALFERVAKFGHTNRWQQFVSLLPADAEARAIILWRTHHASRTEFARAVLISEGRPWHRFAAHALLNAEDASEVDASLINRDWTGADAKAVDTLAQFVRKWPPTAIRQNYSSGLRMRYSTCPDLPPAVIVPLVENGDSKAWDAFCKRDPRLALDWARDSGRADAAHYYECARMLPRHGVAADLPLALRVLGGYPINSNSTEGSHLRVWLDRTCPGDLRIFSLADPATRIEPRSDALCRRVVHDAASKARMADFEAIFAKFAHLTDQGQQLIDAWRDQVEPEHAAALIRAIDTERQRELLTYSRSRHNQTWEVYLLAELLDFVVRTGDPAGLAAAHRVLDQKGLPGAVQTAAAQAVVQLTTADRAATIRKLLDSERVVVVSAALDAADLGGLDLHKNVAVAVVRMGDQLNSLAALFRSMAPPARVELAIRVLDHANSRKFTAGVVMSAIDVLAEQRNAIYIPQLAKGTHHPSEHVRQSAATQLGNTFDKRAVPHLLRLLKDESSTNRVVAKEQLDQIASYLEELEKWERRFKDK